MNPYLGSRAKRRFVNTSSMTWNCLDVIVAVILCELKVRSFKGLTYKFKHPLSSQREILFPVTTECMPIPITIFTSNLGAYLQVWSSTFVPSITEVHITGHKHSFQ